MREVVNGFHHEALLYAGTEGFIAATLPFLRDGVAAGDAMLVAVDAAKGGRLRAALGPDAERVRFADMAQLGANPNRIISAWHDFVAEQRPGTPLRGIGEPIWAGRSDAELEECHRHEALLNVAFAHTPSFQLICPYDTSALDPSVVTAACGTHPHVCADGATRASDAFAGVERIPVPFDAPLAPAPPSAAELRFDAASLGAVRALAGRAALAGGLPAARRDDLVLAVNELATNSVSHAGGGGTLRTWQDGGVVCEVADGGRIENPLAGRRRPAGEQLGGFGLWIVNQLCDFVQVRTYPSGNVVRVRMQRAHPQG